MTPELFQFTKIAGGHTRIEPSYPESGGFKRNGTSQEAAPSAQDARILRDQVLGVIHQRPSTADETAAILGVSVLSCRPRLSELVSLGKIKETSTRRRNASGKMAVVWEAT